MKNAIQDYFNEEINIIRSLDYEKINEAVWAIRDAYEREATIYIFGNGGSGATASHFVGDFNKGISEYLEKKFRLVCLNDNVSSLLAIANDISYEEIFRFQLRGRLRKDDLVIAISGSGNSKNVINAVEYAKSVGAGVVGLTGFSGGKLRELADYSMHVPVEDMQITEDIHMAFDHMMYRVLSDVLSKGRNDN